MSRRLVLTRLCTCEGRTVYTEWSHGVRSIHFSSILATAVARFIRFTGEAASHHSLINSFVRGKIDTKTFILYPPLKPGPGYVGVAINLIEKKKDTLRLEIINTLSIYATIRKIIHP